MLHLVNQPFATPDQKARVTDHTAHSMVLIIDQTCLCHPITSLMAFSAIRHAYT